MQTLKLQTYCQKTYYTFQRSPEFIVHNEVHLNEEKKVQDEKVKEKSGETNVQTNVKSVKKNS